MEASQSEAYLLADESGNVFAVPPDVLEQYKLSDEDKQALEAEHGGADESGEGEDEVSGFRYAGGLPTAPLGPWGASLIGAPTPITRPRPRPPVG